MKRSFFASMIIAAIICSCNSTSILTAPATPEAINAAIDSGKWVFVPRQIRPQYGRARQTNAGNYRVTHTNSKLTVYLPYYGRAYGGADVLRGRGPLDFSSVNFSSDKREVKEGEWRIVIVPKAYNEVRSMNFILYNNGSASLDIIMTNRTAISFDGVVAPLP